VVVSAACMEPNCGGILHVLEKVLGETKVMMRERTQVRRLILSVRVSRDNPSVDDEASTQAKVAEIAKNIQGILDWVEVELRIR